MTTLNKSLLKRSIIIYLLTSTRHSQRFRIMISKDIPVLLLKSHLGHRYSINKLVKSTIVQIIRILMNRQHRFMKRHLVISPLDKMLNQTMMHSINWILLLSKGINIKIPQENILKKLVTIKNLNRTSL